MKTRIGINGFGRIGRSVFRILAERDDFEVVVINDLFENDQLAYLLKYDTVMGVFEGQVSSDDDSMTVNGQRIVMTAEKNPAAIPWAPTGSSWWSSRLAFSVRARSCCRTSKVARRR